MMRLLDRLATWWLARRLKGDWVAFVNTESRPARTDGVVYPYLTQRGSDGVVRVLAVRRDSHWVETFSAFGEPVTAPDVELARVP